MSVSYQAVLWNRQKKIYDGVLALGVVLFIGLFIGLGSALFPAATAETLLIRALGTAAITLLHLILSIGPLARIDRRFLPLLYNRRHLGVTMFILGLARSAFAIIQFHAIGDANPLVSVLTSNTNYFSITEFPFQPLGLLALIIFFFMAATSHDFWMANLTPPVWKALHMMVYIAYGLLVAHVVLGVLQSETSPVLVAFLLAGFIWITGLHIWSARIEIAKDVEIAEANQEGYINVCHVDDIENFRAHVATISGERVAIWKYGGMVSAISNVCQHQNGPLGEGRIIDGLVTCPWHGFQYKPEDGSSPEPFTEKIPTFNVKVIDGRILVHPVPNLPGTRVEPAIIEA